jgi:hypothetical protein
VGIGHEDAGAAGVRSGTLQLYAYAALIADRRPASIGIAPGTAAVRVLIWFSVGCGVTVTQHPFNMTGCLGATAGERLAL